MSAHRALSSTGFVGQGVLIILPVLVLAAVGFLSLRQDKILAEFDAKERAQNIAENLAQTIWETFAIGPDRAALKQLSTQITNAGKSLFTFQISSEGDLLYPPPFLRDPTPASPDLGSLSQDQLRSWSEARDAEFRGSSLETMASAYRRFLTSAPPERFAAAADFALGIIFQRQEQPQAAKEMFELVARNYPGAVSESGLQLAPLAEFKLVELLLRQRPIRDKDSQQLAMLCSALCSNATMKPTPLSPYVLRRLAEVEASLKTVLNTRPATVWNEVWNSHEVSRKLYQAATRQIRPASLANPIPLQLELSKVAASTGLQHPVSSAGALLNPLLSEEKKDFPRALWITDAKSWLAVRLEKDPSSVWFACWPEEQVREVIRQTIAEAKLVPDYFGVSIFLGGKEVSEKSNLRVWFEAYHFGRRGGFKSKEYEVSKAVTAALLAATHKPDAGSDLLSVGVHLTSPTTLFFRQRARTLWFGLLIATATLAALLGLITAWRTFHRQQRLAEMKTNFVSSVSHELRAPIASLRLMAEGLEGGRVQEQGKQKEYFRLIVQECRRLTSLIENVLDFSRIEQGRKQYEFEPTDLPALVRNTVQLMQPYAVEREIDLKLITDLLPDDSNSALPFDALRSGAHAPRSTSPGAPLLDGRAIQQALINLIDNALKHSPSRTTVEVGLELPACAPREEAVGTGMPAFRLWVEDHGEGIPPEEQQRIFERFYRRGSELRRETQGVGLGLALVKHVVEGHGGTVLVQSVVGKGSRFIMEVPMKPQTQKKTKEET